MKILGRVIKVIIEVLLAIVVFVGVGGMLLCYRAVEKILGDEHV